MVGSPDEEELPWQEAARTLFELRAEEWTRIIAAGLWKRHPMLRSQVQDMAHEALVRTYVVWQRDAEKRDRNPLPYARETANNLANDAYDKLAEPADEAGLQECERVFVARPSRASDLHGDYAGLVPYTPLDPLEDLVIPAIRRMKKTQRRDVAEMRSQGMEDQAIAERMNREPARIQTLMTKAAAELREDEEIQLHIRDRHRKTRRREEDTGE
ncbi:hypothetical protein NRK68_34320 (plasmid) [Streptomyces yangpuensis]|uniref:Sigma-70 family RNA polymerase sigma factor n=1 Tax=Streptomyces yangpuensis TaxID=1648182 RepID=A0ABY5Q7D2_9ACTN|nr:hypothetical protein [Streptomyces yangpuensis]UUY52351.1 hypothetical protein NRK68_34320 [Streptomyces yangpuensis]